MGGSRLDPRDGLTVRLAAGVASYALKAPLEDILEGERGSAQIAFARQVAMYLCHVAFEWSLARVARAFGRDRSTVGHACHSIEDKRDDESFDAWIETLESMLREAPAPAGDYRKAS